MYGVKSFYLKFMKKLGNTNNILVKGFITLFFPNKFFTAFYRYAIDLKKISNTATISFDCDHLADVEALPELLQILHSYDIKVSFACVGRFIEKYPRLHTKIIENGHEIINHTYLHPSRFDRLSITEQKYEITQCHNVCQELLNYEPIGFRIPHFAKSHNASIYEILSELGYVYSSSILAVKVARVWPYSVNGILEFPIVTCPKHPFQAFDTYHAFRSHITSHKNEETFYEVLKELIEFCECEGLYLNIYFDPQDVMRFDNFERFLGCLKERMHLRTFNDMIDVSRWESL